jgi:SAM-dependent methyltransferase
MPLANGFLRPEETRPPPAFPLAVAYCGSCHLVQLTDRVDPETLFSDYLYFSSYSDTFLRHAREMAGLLSERLGLGAGSRVIEVASNDGYLLQYFLERNIAVLGIEPALNVAQVAVGRGIPTLNRFFGPEAVPEVLSEFGPADLLIGNNVLAHVPEVNGFLAAARACLKPEGTAVFEFPYLRGLLDETQFDTIYHEHVFYFSLSAVESLAERAGFELTDVSREPVHGGSLRVFLQPRGRPRRGSAVKTLLRKEDQGGLTGPDLYRRFSSEVAGLKRSLRGLLSDLKATGKRLAAYGAPAKGNTLLNHCGIGTDLLDFTVDRSPHKQGLRLPGSNIPIERPEKVLEARPDYLLILPWNIKEEIMEQMSAIRGWGGKFIVPIPEVKVLP